MGIAEAKIDDSFRSSQFHIPGYHPPFRRDRNAYGGGLLVFICSDIIYRALPFECDKVELIPIELTLDKLNGV